MMIKRLYLIFIFISTNFLIFAQHPVIQKVEPPNWWANHSYNKIQLMIYGKNLDSVNFSIDCNYINIEKIIYTKNSNYVFINLEIDTLAKPDNYKFKLTNKFGDAIFEYPILLREESSNRHNGFDQNDVVYLIFPDRFVNGDHSNDFRFNDKEEFEFGSLNGRHGGDIQGIINSLDYLKDLGITTIWSTPLLENNMYMSYHGYAATNLYKIDPRHGNNELYKELVNKAHEKGIKIIYDHVANHIGINHEWIGNLPTETWLNGSVENHILATHNKIAYLDIYSHPETISNSTDGWFVKYMPDLNQQDSLVSKYIIQNSIWWIEYSGIDGIREDTYPYSDQKFMAEWAETILSHYPNFNIVGEVWKGLPSVLAGYQTNSYFPKELDSKLPVVTDFAFTDALVEYLTGKSELYKIYETLAQDFVYSNPNNLLVFFDNHDIDRGMFAAKGNLHKYKTALTLVLTTRGIPQLFYGTEIGLDGGEHHGKIREPFPSGFLDNQKDAFTSNGRNKLQNDIFDFTKTLLQLRKKYPEIRNGYLTQFPPKDNIYIYKKNIKKREILFIINDSFENKNIDFSYYLNGEIPNSIFDLLNDKNIEIDSYSKFGIPKQSVSIYLIQ
jgi:glycosidase